MDFIVDGLATGRMVRVPSVVEVYTRECLALEADASLGSGRVTQVLERLIEERGRPEDVRSENGPEFTARRCWPSQRTGRSGWCLSSQAARCKTATSRASTDGCATNASTQAGSGPGTMCATLWRVGARSITRNAGTVRWATQRRSGSGKEQAMHLRKAHHASHIYSHDGVYGVSPKPNLDRESPGMTS